MTVPEPVPEPVLLPAQIGGRLHPGDEEREPHREDRKQVVKRDRQRELQPIDGDVAAHEGGSRPPRAHR